MESVMEVKRNLISALNFAEKCIKLVVPSSDLFIEAKTCYRVNKINITQYVIFRENTPEYSIALAYDYFRFACINKEIGFFMERDEEFVEIKDKFFVRDHICELFEGKGIIKGADIYMTENAYDLLMIGNNVPIYNSMVNDSFMLKCYKKVVEHIMSSLKTKNVPPLKESALSAYVDELFPPSEYPRIGFSSRKKEALISLFNKQKAA